MSREGTLNNGSSHSLRNETEKSGVAAQGDHPRGLKLVLLTIALLLSVFLVAIDNTIIATAIPHITDQFHSLDDVGWYGSAYLLATSATQLLFGKFYTFMPIKWVFITAIVIFEVGSAICGAAPNSNALIVGRAIAGFGCAGIFSGALIIIAYSVPLEKRPLFMGLLSANYGIASVAGPLMGGAFTDKVSWRWCFYINLPIGGVALFVMLFFFKMPESAKSKPENITLSERFNRFDPLGTFVFIPAIVSLLLALQWGGSKYPWHNGRIIGLLVVFGVLMSVFVCIQLWKQENGTVPPRVFKQRSIWAGAIYVLCMGAAFFINIFYLPIWFQAIKGVSAVKSGIDNLPLILSLVIASLVAGVLITHFGHYGPFLLLSSLMMAVGAGLISTFKTNTAHAHWIGYQVIFGLGVGFGMQQPILACQAALPMADVAIGTSIIMFVQTLGGALFISIGQNVFTNKLVEGLVAHVPGVSPATVVSAGATSLKDTVPPQYLPAVLRVYNAALVSAFYVAVAMAALSIIGSGMIEWRSIKAKKDDTEVEVGAAG